MVCKQTMDICFFQLICRSSNHTPEEQTNAYLRYISIKENFWDVKPFILNTRRFKMVKKIIHFNIQTLQLAWLLHDLFFFFLTPPWQGPSEPSMASKHREPDCTRHSHLWVIQGSQWQELNPSPCPSTTHPGTCLSQCAWSSSSHSCSFPLLFHSTKHDKGVYLFLTFLFFLL